jgi:ABC-type glycerol-3-phosphate transport system permease component
MKRNLAYLGERALLVLISVVVLFPIAWMFLTAFKQPRDAYSLSLDFEPTFRNFVTVFSDPKRLSAVRSLVAMERRNDGVRAKRARCNKSSIRRYTPN